MSGNSYNGFTAAERRFGGRAINQALADGRLRAASFCSVCLGALVARHAWHLEDYAAPLSAYPICRRCHYAVHIRFRRPDYWQRFLRELPAKTWVHDLTATGSDSILISGLASTEKPLLLWGASTERREGNPIATTSGEDRKGKAT